MNDGKTLTDFQTDALKEVGNIGIGHATTSLSQMVNKQVGISLPELRLIPLLTVPTLVKNEEAVVGIILELKGDAKGFLLLLLSKPTAKFLIRLVIGEADLTKEFDEMEIPVLKELGNIMGGTYITALSNFLSISIGLSPPSEIYDMSGAIINQVVCLLSPDVEDVLFLKTRFDINSEKIDGKILIFTDSQSLTKMLEAINKMVGK